MRWLWLGSGLTVAAVAGAAWLGWDSNAAKAPAWRSLPVERGPLTASVSSSGTLQPVTSVVVGSQISGQIRELLADFNSIVVAGQVIARLDPDSFAARVAQASANLEVAKAAVATQEAALVRSRADMAQVQANAASMRANAERAESALAEAVRENNRKAPLAERGVLSPAERDRAQSAVVQAKASLDAGRAQERSAQSAIASAEASVRMAEAQLGNARAQVRQREAELKAAEIDLERTVIRAPVSGTVVNRAVDIGQTVAASLQAPVLFTIAADLTAMQVETSVDEADVGRVRDGQAGTFTVDAFPGRTFAGRVTQIRKAPQVIQNVVTYKVIIGVANPDGRLLPGMTANVRIVTDERADALKIPNAALRFRPPGQQPEGPQSASQTSAGAAPMQGPQMRSFLVKELELDAGQQAQLDEILAATRQRIMAMTAEGLAEPERRQRSLRIRQETGVRIAAILTPAQRGRYQALQASQADGGRTGRAFVLGTDGQPQPVTLRLGLNDGSATEVIGGDLKAGDRVLVGVPAQGATSGSAGGMPRLRL